MNPVDLAEMKSSLSIDTDEHSKLCPREPVNMSYSAKETVGTIEAGQEASPATEASAAGSEIRR
jgi:hypothetical protein